VIIADPGLDRMNSALHGVAMLFVRYEPEPKDQHGDNDISSCLGS